MLNPRSGAYGGGYGDFFGYRDLLADWRAQGDFEGWELDRGRRRGRDRRGRHRRRRRHRCRHRRGARSPGCVRRDRRPGRRGRRHAPRAEAPRPPPRSASSTPAARPGRRTSRSPTTTRSTTLFAGLVDEFGALDAVVNVAGISRPTGFAAGAEDDWRAVLERARRRLPQRAAGRAADHGRRRPRPHPRRHLGIGVARRRRRRLQLRQAGRRRAHLAASATETPRRCDRQRAVADRRHADGAGARCSDRPAPATRPGATRPPGACRSARCRRPSTSGRSARTSPETTFSVVERAGRSCSRTAPSSRGWSRRASSRWPRIARGRVAAAPPRRARSGGVRAGRGGAGEQRRGQPARRHRVRRGSHRMEAPDRASGAASSSATTRPGATRSVDALSARGVECVGIGAWQGRRTEPARAGDRVRTPSRAQLAGVARDAGPVDAVVVALGAGFDRPAADGPAWQRVLDEHAGITDRIRTDAAWVRAVSDLAAATDRPVRVVTVVEATTAGGRSRAQAAAQLVARRPRRHVGPGRRLRDQRGGRAGPGARPPRPRSRPHLVCSPEAGSLSGAELVADAEWIGLRSHPHPAGAISFGGPAVPGWVDGALRTMVAGGPRR